MKKIVIATDGSPSARAAVAYGLELAAEQRAEAVIVHVAPAVDVLPTAALGYGAPGARPHEPTPDDRAALEEAAARAGEAGVPVTTVLLSGDAVDEIVAYADEIDAEMIVVGSRGHGAMASTVLGSVSHGVIHEARRPVLVVRRARVRTKEPALVAA